ncbi:MAG: fatty acid desaturase [Phycisphaeraceae bacterium]|nr:fatty acid desaturase [Phycisphaeraceae bacterium]
MSRPDDSVPSVPPRGGIEWNNLNWTVVIAIAALHAVAVAAVLPMFFSWSGLVLFLVLGWLTGGIGITLCYHRLLTHRSFRTPRWFEYLLTLCACLAWQGGPVEWVGVHRLHHKHSDDDHDPHSPKHGFTWSHILWMLRREIEGIRAHEAARDLLRDPVMRRIDRWFWVPQIVLAGLLLGVGWWIGGWMLGLSWVIWGVALRTVVVFHVTWFVNSASHTWGYQNFKETGDDSTNLWWVALLSFGEGWHNNHHAHPRSAAHGMRWFEFDLTWQTIRLLSWVGLARDIHRPPVEVPDAPSAEKPAPARDICPEPLPALPRTAGES